VSKCPECGHRWQAKDARKQKILMVVWGILLVPSLVWWREQIWWVVFMSWYANFVGHWSAEKGAEAKEANEDG
jgi:hypothetical protein